MMVMAMVMAMVKVKKSKYRPAQALRAPGV
jgi:hypothetical protein